MWLQSRYGDHPIGAGWPFLHPAVTALDPSPVIPIRAVPPQNGAPRNRLLASGLVSLCGNLAVLAGLVHLAFPPAHSLPEPNTISVDLVPEVPKPKAPQPMAVASAQPPAQPKPQPPEAPSHPAPTGMPAAPAPEVKRAEDDPAKQPAPAPPAPPQAAAAPPTEQSETPPAIDSGSDPTPRLVEAPPAPSQAAEQSEKNQAANAETKPAATEKPTERPPSAAPEVLASTNPAAETAPTAASTAETATTAAAASPEEKREAENTAKLAAALPYSQSFMPEENRAVVSGKGASTAKEYRGEVYGAFHKADDIVAAARTRNLRGQAVVVFTIDDQGLLTSETIALTSGNPEVDRVALEIIRRAAPFPPPPPGGQHTFSPAIALGLD